LIQNQVQRRLHQLQKVFRSKNFLGTETFLFKFSFFRPLFDSKALASEDSSTQSSPPESRAKNVAIQETTSQRFSANLSRANSHDSATSATAMKVGRMQKVRINRLSTTLWYRVLFRDSFEGPICSLQLLIAPVLGRRSAWHRVPPLANGVCQYVSSE
jgi:hypothetical protein